MQRWEASVDMEKKGDELLPFLRQSFLGFLLGTHWLSTVRRSRTRIKSEWPWKKQSLLEVSERSLMTDRRQFLRQLLYNFAFPKMSKLELLQWKKDRESHQTPSRTEKVSCPCLFFPNENLNSRFCSNKIIVVVIIHINYIIIVLVISVKVLSAPRRRITSQRSNNKHLFSSSNWTFGFLRRLQIITMRHDPWNFEVTNEVVCFLRFGWLNRKVQTHHY